ncbi:hypothetical protein [Maricaulis sp. CAU 1757]
MTATVTALDFAPLLPWAWLASLGGVAVTATAFAAWRRMGGWIWRLMAIAGILLVLANPSLVEEERDPLADIAILMTDRSASMEIGGRSEAADAVAAELRALADTDPTLELVEVQSAPRGDGTMLFDSVTAALASAPPDRLAGVILATDGQVHDAPENSDRLNLDAPLHHVLIGDPEAGDRRLVIEEAPRYGIVGQTAQFVIRVEDPAMQGTAAVSFRFEGGDPQTYPIQIGRSTRIEVPVEIRGQNVIEAEVEPGPEELSLVNNRAAVSVNGVRDRLRVLLVTGEPHNGARAWRDLLKSDPSVDLVHFTILRPPDRRDATPVDELALIGFPVQELFVERLDEFDLVIFDRYRRRGIMPPLYFDYIARYVENGGALLVTAGPPFAGAPSLYRTPLAAVLPVRPTGYITDGPFRPQTTSTGLRHPVTAGLNGDADAPEWGRWLRHIHGDAFNGETLLETPDGQPLLVVQRAGLGRTAIVMSDQTWLWARGFEGGGPYAEMFRRVAHWLMREPQLDEERLTAFATDGDLSVARTTLADQPPPLEVTWPDGSSETVSMQAGEPGHFAAQLPARGTGLVRVRSGDLTTVAALGPINPQEFADLRPTPDRLAPLVDAFGGGLAMVGEGNELSVPTFRRTRAGADQSGRNWIGLQRNERFVVRSATRMPLMPALPVLLALLVALGLSWWREGH